MELENIPEILEQSINVLAEKLNAPAEQLLEITINGIIVDGVMQIIISVILLILCVLSVREFFKRIKKYSDTVEDLHAVIACFIPFFSILFFIIGILGLRTGVIKTFAPVYWIIKQIILY